MDDFINKDTVRELLEKYFDGQTSAVEELTLREFFTAACDVPDDLEYARAIFGFWNNAAMQKSTKIFDIPATENFADNTNNNNNTDNTTDNFVDNKSAAENVASVASIAGNPHTKRHVSARRRNRLLTWACGMAAAVIAAIAILTTTRHETIYCYINGEPVTDYELAYAYAQGALGLIEDNIKKPAEYLMAAHMDNPFEGLRYLEMLGIVTDEEN